MKTRHGIKRVNFLVILQNKHHFLFSSPFYSENKTSIKLCKTFFSLLSFPFVTSLSFSVQIRYEALKFFFLTFPCRLSPLLILQALNHLFLSLFFTTSLSFSVQTRYKTPNFPFLTFLHANIPVFTCTNTST
ncbi:hypothetical protein E2C01_005927 [Portunus trituberculatus]|uniref:Uncharacterized protein n=1 Tax=Portunus trituberculatus TaxID=210409 RepID=A0A5B7CWR7_PORTR|nr:hypothetical protein [Portunus trituberculatus]